MYDKFVTCLQTQNKNTRNVANNQLNIRKYRLATGQRSFYYRGCKLQRLTQTNTYRAFYLSTHPSEKLVFALSGTRTHVSLITSRAC